MTVLLQGRSGATRIADVTASDELQVSVTTGNPARLVDDAVFTPAGSAVTPVGYFADDASTDPVDEGDIGAPRMRAATRVAYAELMDANGVPLGSSTNPLRVSETGTTTQPVSVAGPVTVEVEANVLRGSGVALTPKFAKVGFNTSGTNEAVASVAGKKLRVIAASLISATTNTLYARSSTSGAFLWGDATSPVDVAAQSGVVFSANPYGWFETAAGQALVLYQRTTGPLAGGLTYVETT